MGVVESNKKPHKASLHALQKRLALIGASGKDYVTPSITHGLPAPSSLASRAQLRNPALS